MNNFNLKRSSQHSSAVFNQKILHPSRKHAAQVKKPKHITALTFLVTFCSLLILASFFLPKFWNTLYSLLHRSAFYICDDNNFAQDGGKNSTFFHSGSQIGAPFKGEVKLTQDQLNRMVDLNLNPSDENVQINLSIMAENDTRLNELVQNQSQLPAGMLRLAAKNEAFGFVYQYIKLQNADLDEIESASCRPGPSQLGKHDLPDGHRLSIPYYLQWDNRWGYKSYAGSVIGTYGCGITCMAGVLSYLTGDPNIMPDDLAVLSHSLRTDNSGTDISFITSAAVNYGCLASGIPIDSGKWRESINRGNPIILNVGPGNFTATGHYITIIGYTDQENFIIYDPASPLNTSRLWSISTLKKQNALACWEISKAN